MGNSFVRFLQKALDSDIERVTWEVAEDMSKGVLYILAPPHNALDDLFPLYRALGVRRSGHEEAIAQFIYKKQIPDVDVAFDMVMDRLAEAFPDRYSLDYRLR